MSRIPISLIIDDAGPVNTYHFHDLGHEHEFLVPPAFLREFIKICERTGIKGKFSVVPIPAGLGRIDQKISYVPQATRKAYLKLLKEKVQGRFSITPEILTHYLAYNPETCHCMHLCEDEYFSKLDAESISRYVGFALEILTSAGLSPSGVTSPWMCGLDNEVNYAKGIGMAFKRTLNKDKCFYFLHSRDKQIRPLVACDSKETGKVVSIPNNTFDAFWETQNPIPEKKAIRNAVNSIDKLLSADGRSGMILDHFHQENPIILISHWQSLFSDGRAIGLAGLELLATRINQVFGDTVEWVNFDELAARY